MDGVQFNYALLEKLSAADGPAGQRALLQALEMTQGMSQAVVLQALLKRRGDALRGHIARLIAVLDEQATEALANDPSSLEPIARAALADTDAGIRLNMVRLLERAGHACWAYLLAGATTDAALLVRRQAAESLRNMVRAHRGSKKMLDEHIAPAVLATLRNYKVHQQMEVIQAAILLGFGCPSEILHQLDRPANRLSGPLAEALRSMLIDDAAGFVLAGLQYKSMAHVMRSHISQCDWPSLAALARHEHYVALRPIAESIREIKNLHAIAEDPAGLGDLPQAEQGPVLRVVMATGIAEAQKDALLSLLLTGEASAAQAAISVVLDRRQRATELILLALHSRHREVQCLAAGRVVSTGADSNLTEHLLESLPGMPDPVRGMMSQYLAAEGFERYWRNFNRLGKQVREKAGRALLKLDARVVDLLASRLVSHDSQHQLQATQMARQLNMTGRFEAILCQHARHGEKTVRSAAAAALGEVDSFAARSTLAGCLHDDDSRVQANAIEALAILSDDPAAVMDKINSSSNRVRANAIKWMLEKNHKQGAIALAEMLTDSRVMHRISALWVVKTLRFGPAARILDRLALRDEDAKVRARAATALRELRVERLEEVEV